METGLAVAKVVGVEIAARLARGLAGIGGEYDALACQFEAFATTNIAAGNHFVDTHHIRARIGEAPLIFLAGAARQLLLFRADHPANGIRIFLAAMRTHQGQSLGLRSLGVKLAFIHRRRSLSTRQQVSRDLVHCNKLESSVPPPRQPVLQRGQDVMSIRTLLAGISIVQENDFAAVP